MPHHAIQFIYKRGPNTKGCPTPESLGYLLLDAFHYDPVDPNAKTRLEIEVTRRDKAYHAEILLTGPDGQVVYAGKMDDPSRCRTLTRDAVTAAYIEIRMNLDPPEGPPSEPAPAMPAVSPPSQPAAQAPVTAASLSPARSPVQSAPSVASVLKPWEVRLGLGTEANWGLLPGLGAGGYAFVTGSLGRFSLSGELWGLGSVFLMAPFPRARGASAGGGVVPCLRVPTVHALFVSLCGALAGGMLTVSVEDAQRARPPRPLVTLAARPGIEWRIGERFALHGHVEVGGLLLGGAPGRNQWDAAWPESRLYGSLGLAVSVRP